MVNGVARGPGGVGAGGTGEPRRSGRKTSVTKPIPKSVAKKSAPVGRPSKGKKLGVESGIKKIPKSSVTPIVHVALSSGVGATSGAARKVAERIMNCGINKYIRAAAAGLIGVAGFTVSFSVLNSNPLLAAGGFAMTALGANKIAQLFLWVPPAPALLPPASSYTITQVNPNA